MWIYIIILVVIFLILRFSNEKENIGVFLSANDNIYDFKQQEQTIKQFINLLDVNKHILVYGGTNYGLVNILGDEYFQKGGTLIGVISDEVINKAETNNIQFIRTENIQMRVEQMISMCNKFIIFPGGLGTLDELFTLLVDTEFNKNKKIFLINMNNHYDTLLKFLEELEIKKYLRIKTKDMINVVNNIDELKKYIN